MVESKPNDNLDKEAAGIGVELGQVGSRVFHPPHV